MIQNIIFDMDGTLLNTAKSAVPACHTAAKEFGLPPVSPEVIRQTIGWANPEFYYRLYPRLPKELVELYGEAVEVQEAALVEALGPDILFDGILDLLEVLKGHGCSMAVASTGSWDHVDGALRAAGIQDYFDLIRCDQPVKIRMVQEIIALRPLGGWLMIGDKDKDAVAGRENGILTIGAAYGFGTEAEMALFDHVIQHPIELLPHVLERYQ